LTTTRTQSFTLGSRSITVEFEFYSTELPVDHYSGATYAWNGINSATITASSGAFYQGEVINLVKTLSSGNPFRLNHPQVYTLSSAGPSYVVTTVSGNSNNTLTLGNSGNLTLATSGGSQLWSAGVSVTSEPLVQTGTANPLEDVCGKRITSCKKRFGEYAELPFGSFPSVGTFYS